MNELRPEIAPLATAVTDKERADALLRMSASALISCEFTIRNRLQVAGFRAGTDYLDAALSALRSPRDGNGWLPDELVQAWDRQRGAISFIAVGGQG